MHKNLTHTQEKPTAKILKTFVMIKRVFISVDSFISYGINIMGTV